MKCKCVLGKNGKLKEIQFYDVSEVDESNLLLRCHDLAVSRNGSEAKDMAEKVLAIFTSANLAMPIGVVERLSKYCHTGSSWKNCMAPAQDIVRFLFSDYSLPRLLPKGPEYGKQCQEIIDFIGNLYRKKSKKAAAEEITPEDAAEITATENLAIERRIMARSRNREMANKRKKMDDYTCQACRLRLVVNGRFIVDCHHKDRLSKDDVERQTTLKSLITLCPTCHRVAHTRLKPLSLKEIKKEIGNP